MQLLVLFSCFFPISVKMCSVNQQLKLRCAKSYRLSGHGADLEKVKTIGSAEGGRYRVDLSHQ